MKQRLIYTNAPGEAIDTLVKQLQPTLPAFVITDSNVDAAVLPMLGQMSSVISSAQKIVCQPGDQNKSLEALSHIWSFLNVHGATRSSIIINVGGGMITDMGGFAAATFKRGVRFINVPTTLLAAVDASVGGKTGINFNGNKNEIGNFAESEAAVISTLFFDTLPQVEMISGYAEMIKHALLDSREAFNELMRIDIAQDTIDRDALLAVLEKSVNVKRRIVETDIHEHGLRKALNLGHTVGHAFESLALRQGSPIPHGYAVAWGMVVELVLSNMLCQCPSSLIQEYASYVKRNYSTFQISCRDYPALIELMGHDKKNHSASAINFSLLRDIGDVALDCTASESDIKTALDIYCDLMGC